MIPSKGPRKAAPASNVAKACDHAIQVLEQMVKQKRCEDEAQLAKIREAAATLEALKAQYNDLLAKLVSVSTPAEREIITKTVSPIP